MLLDMLKKDYQRIKELGQSKNIDVSLIKKQLINIKSDYQYIFFSCRGERIEKNVNCWQIDPDSINFYQVNIEFKNTNYSNLPSSEINAEDLSFICKLNMVSGYNDLVLGYYDVALDIVCIDGVIEEVSSLPDGGYTIIDNYYTEKSDQIYNNPAFLEKDIERYFNEDDFLNGTKINKCFTLEYIEFMRKKLFELNDGHILRSRLLEDSYKYFSENLSEDLWGEKEDPVMVYASFLSFLDVIHIKLKNNDTGKIYDLFKNPPDRKEVQVNSFSKYMEFGNRFKKMCQYEMCDVDYD